jgi:tetratricopeptide (TPR) repeat protein
MKPHPRTSTLSVPQRRGRRSTVLDHRGSLAPLPSPRGFATGSQPEPFTAELTLQPGEPINQDPCQGFAENMVTLRAISQGSLDSGLVDLAWGSVQLPSRITVAVFLRDFARGAATAHADALETGKIILKRLLGHPSLRDRWNKISQWRGSTRPLRLELVLPRSSQSPIHAIPFELLADETFLFYSGRSVLVRCVRDREPRAAIIRPEDRVLVAWANPADVQPPVADSVFEQHSAALGAAAGRAGLQVTTLERTSSQSLHDALTANRPVPVVSLMVHGAASGGRVWLEDQRRNAAPLAVSSVAAELREANTQVALLWSCHSVRHHEDLGSLADLLLQEQHGDLAAVLAAHGAVRADWTPSAAERIFTSLAGSSGNDFELAISSGRRALSEEDAQWASLTYYARPLEGRSVTFEQAAQQTIQRLLAAAPVTSSVEDLPSRPYYWVNRSAEIEEVMAMVRAHRLVTVRGMPGIGKTEVAREAASRLASEPGGDLQASLWISLDKVGAVSSLRARLAEWAGLPAMSFAEQQSADTLRRAPDLTDAMLARVVAHKQALWILDNAEDLIRTEGPALRELLATVLERCPGIHLLATSLRPLGNLRSVPEHTHVVHRISDPGTCREIFMAASASQLAVAVNQQELATLVDLLDGHPRSLVLVAGQVRDGGANLKFLHQRLLKKGDEAVLAAELLDADIAWSSDDKLRVERLVSSLNLAYLPLLNSAPAAAELFAWLGTLPAGLPVAMACTIFGSDTMDHIATLRRHSLVEVRSTDERLELPAPIRWYAARQLRVQLSAARREELLQRTFAGIESLMWSAYQGLGKPGAGRMIALGVGYTPNLNLLLQTAKELPSITTDLSSHIARSFSIWARVIEFGKITKENITILSRAAELTRESTTVTQSDLCAVVGSLHLRMDNIEAAESCCQRALSLLSTMIDPLRTAKIHQTIGSLYSRSGRFKLADEQHLYAFNCFKEANHGQGQAASLKAIADMKARLGDMNQALVLYNRALCAFDSSGDELGTGNTFLAIAGVYDQNAQKRSIAETYYLKALDIHVRIDNTLGEANTRLSLAYLYAVSDRIRDSQKELYKSLELFRDVPHLVGVANAISVQGTIFLFTDRLHESFECFRAAHEQLTHLQEPLSATGQLGYMSRASFLAGRFERAFRLAGLAWLAFRRLEATHEMRTAIGDMRFAASNSSVELQRITQALGSNRWTLNERIILEHFAEQSINDIGTKLAMADEDPFSPLPDDSPTSPSEES